MGASTVFGLGDSTCLGDGLFTVFGLEEVICFGVGDSTVLGLGALNGFGAEISKRGEQDEDSDQELPDFPALSSLTTCFFNITED